MGVVLNRFAVISEFDLLLDRWRRENARAHSDFLAKMWSLQVQRFQLATEVPMTPLRRRMLEDMQLRNLAVNTQKSYLQRIPLFARYFDRPPSVLGPEETRTYQTSSANVKQQSLPTAILILAFGWFGGLRADEMND